MNSNLSTNELFHYTNSIENLIGIIQNGFYPSYCLEFTLLSSLFERQANFVPIPMVSFCDIPINLIDQHVNKYGNYALGLSKMWGEKHGLNPVIYIHPNSILGDSIAAIVNSFSTYKSSMISKESDHTVFQIIGNAAKGFNHLSCFIKQVERSKNELININGNDIQLEIRKFYDEREWRYIPVRNEKLDIPFISHSDFFDQAKLTQHNLELRKYAIPFEFEDLSYIYYKDEEELKLIHEVIENKYKVNLKSLKTMPQIQKLVHI